jgi:hypothetical protein
MFAGVTHGISHIRRVTAACNHAGFAVYHAVPDAAGIVISGLSWL